MVALEKGPGKLLDYVLPDSIKVEPGMEVMVPLRGRKSRALVVEVKDHSHCARVHEVLEVLDKKPLSSNLLKLARWMSSYYAAPFSRVLPLFSPSFTHKKDKTQLVVRGLISAPKMAEMCAVLREKNPVQAKVLEVLVSEPRGMLLSELLKRAEVSRGPIDVLIKKKILFAEHLAIDRARCSEQEYFRTPSKVLNPEQKEALDRIQRSLGTYETHLLFGVTGSGKTEVYMQAIERAEALGMGAILLVPEIALTAQTLERLRSRFAQKIAIFHHRLSPTERKESWESVARGEILLVVGARSALFSPVKNLGLIIVDEEQESSYKQMDSAPCYHARDVAIMRGKYEGATVVLGSATPSIESYHRALEGRYLLSHLGARAGPSVFLPKVTIVDMKKEASKGAQLFSDLLLEGIKKRYLAGEQTLIFLNKRGFHTYPVCSVCAEGLSCPHCSRYLTHHPKESSLLCHLCGYKISPLPRQCPKCLSFGSIEYKGCGTQKVESALHALLPDVRTLRLDADTTKHVGSHERLFKQFRSGKADVLIGTQMIGKGLHFPAVTLVGIIHADAPLHIPDFRATEQAFQLITQVAGRSGRAELPGEVIVQTTLSSHPLMASIQRLDFIGFYKEEIETRRLFNYPPFSFFTRCVLSGPSQEKVFQAAQLMRAQLINKMSPAYSLHPVAPCGHARIKGDYRFHFLIQGPPAGPLLQDVVPPKGARLVIDVDPTSTFF